MNTTTHPPAGQRPSHDVPRSAALEARRPDAEGAYSRDVAAVKRLASPDEQALTTALYDANRAIVALRDQLPDELRALTTAPSDTPSSRGSHREVAQLIAAVDERARTGEREGRTDESRDLTAIRDALVRHLSVADRAREALMKAHLRLVMFVAKRFRNRGLPWLDLVQEGNIGLMRGIDRFDPHRGVKLSTYVTWWIRENIFHALADTGRMIRVPSHVGRPTRHGEPRSPEQRSRELAGVPREPLRFEQPLGVEGDLLVGDLVADTDAASALDAIMSHELEARVPDLLASLSDREQDVLRRRFGVDRSGEEETLAEIGGTLGLTRERVRQIERAALDKLRYAPRPAVLGRELLRGAG